MKTRFPQFYHLIILFFFLSSSIAYPQFESVDAKVKLYPKTFSRTEDLSAKINHDFSRDDERARAIFTWIALNIRYDLNEYITGSSVAYSYSSPEDKIEKEKKYRLTLVNKTLKSGKAVCEGYASLFTNLCAQSGIEAVIIAGTSRNHYSLIGKLPKQSDHAWNAVKLNGQWRLVDVTWAAGVVDDQGFKKVFNDAYFMTPPDKFFHTHYPDDPKWLLTTKTPEDFANQAFYYPTYVKSNFKFNINSGVVKFVKNLPVEFKVENLKPTDRVYYITSRDNTLDRVAVDDQNKFLIYPSAKLTGYLTIFINEKPIVSYKIARS
ncbi:MAG TPA: transglutaminase domain-containing protein [Flavobacterium sp.]